MKWVFAGLSFAFLVALAVGTVAVKAANVRTTARIEKASMEVEFCLLEVERRSLSGAESPELLARIWRRMQDRMLVDSR
jgi:hypothetical protein